MNKELDEILEECVDDYYKTLHPIAEIKQRILLWHDREKRKWASLCIPPKSFSKATSNGAQYISDYDEGFNCCRDITQDNLERKENV